MWIRPASKLLKNLALIICPFFSFGGNLEGAEVIAPMKIVAQASGSYGPA
jgi:hypothetical protein